MAKFVLAKTPDGQYYFTLRTDSGERLLTSEVYPSKGSALHGIGAVRRFSANPALFEARVSSAGKPYFILKAPSGEVVAVGEEFSSTAAMDGVLAAVRMQGVGAAPEQRTQAGRVRWDVFISHASEDKDEVAAPLARALTARGIRVWFDVAELTLGDSLRRRIDEGLKFSRYGLVILSHSFFAKEWPQRELDGLTAREHNGEKVILPVWHEVSREDISKYSPMLADRMAIPTSGGIEAVVEAVARAIESGKTGA